MKTKTIQIKKEDNQTKRYSNLNTILMVEDFLKAHKDLPMKITEIKKHYPHFTVTFIN